MLRGHAARMKLTGRPARTGTKPPSNTHMQISPIGSNPSSGICGNDPFAKAKQAFQTLETALNSGNLSDAKAAFAELQKNAPPHATKGDNPMSGKMETLGKALDSGDVNAAKDALADIKKTISQRPSAGGGRHGGPGDPPPGGGNKTSGGAEASGSSKVYDSKDTNQDGKVSLKEEQAYAAKQQAAQELSSADSQTSRRSLKTWA